MKPEINSVLDVEYIFNLLGIKEITNARQKKNGTNVYELPIKKMYSTGIQYAIKFATYKTGYVRNISSYNFTCYQINKTKKVKKEVPWSDTPFVTSERILITKPEDRLIYLCKFILKNYYQKPLFTMCNWNIKLLKENNKNYDEIKNDIEETREVQVIVDGHRYRIC
jgi:hypothetical protein|tara:strand:- start:7446 stop:7946 length:501 start_codon:yes stop_codon:yes gene_type:complete